MVNEIPLDAKTYEEKASQFREDLIRIYTPSDHDVKERIASDEDVCTTYCGYIKFLNKDLEHTMEDSSKSQHKKKCEQIAKKMIVRGAVCLSNLIEAMADCT